MSQPNPVLYRYLDRNCHETRDKWREFTKDDIFKPIFNIGIDAQKELALKRLKKLSEQRVFSAFDFFDNPLNVFANHEMAGYVDGSFATKLTVQYNLFGGSVVTLGSERHRSIAKGIEDLSVIGCFALTELGFGNNAIEMQTQAVYDQKTQEFVIHSPTVLSQKYWITNGALHSNYAVVFAQLILDGKNEGIHTFLVRIREKDGSLSKGVWLEDLGAKIGLNGVDNARIKFDHLRAGRESLLNKYSDVTPEGKLVTTIAKRRDRFLRMADRLLSGRICIASMILSATKFTLVTTYRYGRSRLAVGSTGLSDQPIGNFKLFQNAIYPLLASTICMNIAHGVIKDMYIKFSTSEPTQEIVTLCCFIKPFITWNARNVAATCVERTGGQGYLSANRLGETIAFAHSGITAEGDNRVLMQKVTKELLSMLQKGSVSKATPSRNISEIKTLTLNDILDLLKVRESANIDQLQNITLQGMGKGKDFYQIWMMEENDLVQEVAQSYGDRKTIEFCINELTIMPEALKAPLSTLMLLHGLGIVRQNLAWFLIHKIITQELSLASETIYKQTISQVHTFAHEIANGFGIPEHLLTAPIAQNYEDYNSRPNLGEVYTPKL